MQIMDIGTTRESTTEIQGGGDDMGMCDVYTWQQGILKWREREKHGTKHLQ